MLEVGPSVSMICFFKQVKVNDTEYNQSYFFKEAIPVSIIMQNHNFINSRILFYKVPDFIREINIQFLLFWILCGKFYCTDELRQLPYNAASWWKGDVFKFP